MRMTLDKSIDSFHHQRFPWSGGDVTRGRRGQDADVTAASPSSDSTAEEGETARVDGSRQLIIITMITANKRKEREREREIYIQLIVAPKRWRPIAPKWTGMERGRRALRVSGAAVGRRWRRPPPFPPIHK